MVPCLAVQPMAAGDAEDESQAAEKDGQRDKMLLMGRSPGGGILWSPNRGKDRWSNQHSPGNTAPILWPVPVSVLVRL